MSNYDRALEFTLKWEGGKADNVDDHGGRTNRGITQRVYDAACEANGWPKGDVWDATLEQTKAIYKTRYWDLVRGDDVPWPVCAALFDTAVLHGTNYAITRLQSVVHTTPDGAFGPKTLEAVLGYQPYAVTTHLLQLRDDRYEELIEHDRTQQKFYGGWERRCDALCDLCGIPHTIDAARAA